MRISRIYATCISCLYKKILLISNLQLPYEIKIKQAVYCNEEVYMGLKIKP